MIRAALGRALDRAEAARLAQGAAPPAIVVLDAGCGRSSALARHRARIGRFVGIDVHEPAPGALPYLDEFATVDLCENANAYPANTFDLVLSSFTIEHFADPGAAFANLARWLRPGGSLVLTTVNRRHPFVAAYLVMPNALRRRIQPLRQGERRRRTPARRRLQPAGRAARRPRQGRLRRDSHRSGEPPGARLGAAAPDLRPRARRRPAHPGHAFAPLHARRHGPDPGAHRVTGRQGGDV